MRSFSSIPLLTVLLSLPVLAQSQTTWSPRQFTGETLTVDVDVVDVYFTVKHNHRFVENLQKEDFVLLENNRKQEIRYFSAESQAQLSLGMLIDTSDSESPMLQREREIARRFLDTVLLSGDEAMVATFDSNVEVKQEFTGDRDLVVRGIARSENNRSHRTPDVDPGPLPKNPRSTALYDAIVGLSEHRFADRRGRKAMIIITDGQDMGSRASAQKAVEAALKANSICYVLLVGDPTYMADPIYVGGQKMSYLANETGGRVLTVGKTWKELESSLLEIAAELRHHYSIGYSPDDRRAKGEYRRISIRSHHGYRVQSRRGYYYSPHSNLDAETHVLTSGTD